MIRANVYLMVLMLIFSFYSAIAQHVTPISLDLEKMLR